VADPPAWAAPAAAEAGAPETALTADPDAIDGPAEAVACAPAGATVAEPDRVTLPAEAVAGAPAGATDAEPAAVAAPALAEAAAPDGVAVALTLDPPVAAAAPAVASAWVPDGAVVAEADGVTIPLWALAWAPGIVTDPFAAPVASKKSSAMTEDCCPLACLNRSALRSRPTGRRRQMLATASTR